MANLDIGRAAAKPAAFAQNRAGEEPHRTQYMLVITATASVSIIVVAALFMSLF
jgi:hypothetical protein